MKNIAVIIRTYSRVEDTKELVKIIKHFWNRHNYTLFVVHNGKNDGYLLDESIKENAEIIEVENNVGHRSGAQTLVEAGYKHIKNLNNFDYILFIESDFWLLDDAIIHKAIQDDKDISTSIWIEKRQSLGVDFFLVKKNFIDANPDLLDWKASPETDMRDAFIKSKGSLYIFEELRPIHAPSLMRKMLKNHLKNTFYEGGRFRLFLEAPALTHHVEDLENGMDTKKALANAILKELEKNKNFISQEKTKASENIKSYFSDSYKLTLSFTEKYMQKIAHFYPQSSWFSIKKIK